MKKLCLIVALILGGCASNAPNATVRYQSQGEWHTTRACVVTHGEGGVSFITPDGKRWDVPEAVIEWDR